MLKPPAITDGNIEAIKWVALFSMVIDHINKYALNGAVPWMYDIGRLAMPLFAMVMGYQLARPGLLESTAWRRISARLLISGACASVPYIAMGTEISAIAWGWWPLNIMFTFLVALLAEKLISNYSYLSALVALVTLTVGGLIVEYWFPAIFLVMASRIFFTAPRISAGLCCLLGLAAIAYINQSIWGFAAVLVLAIIPILRIRAPRWRSFFYVFYPAHLYALWLLT